MSITKELTEEAIKWAIRGAMSFILLASGWLVRTVYTNVQAFKIIKETVPLIQKDVTYIKRCMKLQNKVLKIHIEEEDDKENK